MRIDYDTLAREIEEALEKQGIWVLATGAEGRVTARSMSVIHQGLTVYFQTNACYIKYGQMKANPQVALCWQNITLEGVATALGNWDEAGNALCDLYKEKHPSSYASYGALEGQVVFRVEPTLVKLWKYVDGKPVRERLNIKAHTAERMDFM